MFRFSYGVASCLVLLSLCAAAPAARGDELLLGSFEGDLSSPIGVNWELQSFAPGPWTGAFVPTEFSEGTQALQITHNANAWEAGLVLSSPTLIDLVTQYDTLKFEVSPSLGTGFRQVFAIMQGDGLNWAQTPELNLVIGDGITPSNEISISLSEPNPGNTSINWKSAALASPGKTWWQLIIGFQGNDNSGDSLIVTTIDNVRFVRESRAGDFDGDTDVDGNDFIDWQLGESPTAMSPTDLADWRTNYGVPNPGVSAVPEPASWALLLTAAAGLVRRGRCRRVPLQAR